MAKKKIVEPTTREDREEIDRKLREQYPQMFKSSWGIKQKKTKESWASKLKKKVKEELKRRRVKAEAEAKEKDLDTVRTKSISSRLRKAGVTEEKISRFRGKK